MNGKRKGLILGAVQIAIVLSLGGKLVYDRATRPSVWVLCRVYDPEHPIRGRYIAENLQMPAASFSGINPGESRPDWFVNQRWAYLTVENSRLVAKPDGVGSGMWVSLRQNPDGTLSAISQQPVLIFIPDNAQIPALARGDEMWVEVTVPKQGPPRPVRLAIRKPDGQFTVVKTS
jgi:hypothetical protein